MRNCFSHYINNEKIKYWWASRNVQLICPLYVQRQEDTMKRKFKQGRSIKSPIITKWAITSQFNWLRMTKNHDTWRWYYTSWHWPDNTMLTLTVTFQDELVFKQPFIDWWLTPTLAVFQIIWISNLSTLSVPDEGYSRNVLCSLILIYLRFFSTISWRSNKQSYQVILVLVTYLDKLYW